MKRCLCILMSVLLLCAIGVTNVGMGTSAWLPELLGRSVLGTSTETRANEPAKSASLPVVSLSTTGMAEFDLTDKADTTTVLANPDKGWYFHYYDNNTSKYGNGKSANYILSYMSYLDHVYLRLPWSTLEPQEGNYNWNFIDSVINDFTSKNKGVSFRITCKEGGDYCPYATPQWVKNAGANGTMMSDGSWEPDYADPIFLQKLSNFHQAFAARYANRDYVRYIDVGAYGDWGEGHTANSSNTARPWSTVKAILDIYAQYYPSSLIVLSDDFVGSGHVSGIGSKGATLRQYVIDHGWTWRDDSICVDWFMQHYASSCSIRSLYLFDEIWEQQPVVMELEHYSEVINTTYHSDNWNNGETFKTACRLTHATYAGFHGYVNEFMSTNSAYAAEMANLLGYWYFIDNASVSLRDNTLSCSLNWRNEGFSKAYNQYTLDIILTDSHGNDHVYTQNSFDNTEIMPKDAADTDAVAPTYTSTHTLDISDLSSDEYTLSVRLHKGNTPVLLALSNDLKGSDGRYSLGKIAYTAYAKTNTSALEDYIYNSVCDLAATGATTVSCAAFASNYDTTAEFVNAITSALNNVFANNYDLFYCRPSKVNSAGTITFKYNSYFASTQAMTQAVTNFRTQCNAIVSQVDPNWSDYNKALFLHDYLVLNAEYGVDSGSNAELSHTAYGVIVNKIGVCDSYSRAYSYLLKLCGIESRCIDSDTMDHEWNLVKLNDNWYHVDVTWDDPTPDAFGRVRHQYFLLTDTEIQQGTQPHTDWETDVECTDTTYSSDVVKNAYTKVYFDGNYYVFVNKSGSIAKFDINQGNTTYLAVVNDKWTAFQTGGYYYANFTSLIKVDNYYVYSTPTGIYATTIAGGDTIEVYEPNCATQEIYGLAYDGVDIVYGMNNTPNTVVDDTYTVPKSITSNRADGVYYLTVGSDPTDLTPSILLTYGTSLSIPVDYDNSINTSSTGSGTATVSYLTYQYNYSYCVYITGDMDNDGRVDSTDFLMIKQIILGISSSTDYTGHAGDLFADGSVDSLDVLVLKQKILNQQ